MKHREPREKRFSARVLEVYGASSLPEGFAIRAAADAPMEILLYDEIGCWGVTAKDFVMALAQCGEAPITLRINSPGGDVFDGLAIYNALRARSAPVNVVVDGIAASAASFIAMAGSSISMAEQSMLMIHNAFGMTIGDRREHADTSAILAKIDGQIASIYAARCGKTVADMAAIMDAETWMTSTEANAAGLCDSIVSPAVKAAEGFRPVARGAFRAQMPPYDPDGDGDNDAEEAAGLINAAIVLLQEATESLSGTAEDDGAEDDSGIAPAMPPMPMVPGMNIAARLRRLRLVEAEDAQ